MSKETFAGVSGEGIDQMVPSTQGSVGCVCSCSSAALSHTAPQRCPQVGRWLCKPSIPDFGGAIAIFALLFFFFLPETKAVHNAAFCLGASVQQGSPCQSEL